MKNILFLLADDLAARVAFSADQRPSRPALNELARRGTIFTQVISSATMTTQCVASLFSGCYPIVNGVRSLRGDVLLKTVPTLAQALTSHGYRTFGLVTGPLWEGTGLERGFDEFEYRDPGPDLAGQWRERIHTLMDDLRGGPSWFIYAHFYDIHAPRVVAREFNRAEFGRNNYERAVATLDRRFAEILGRVDWENTIVAFHADHGEHFPETPWLEFRERFWQDYLLGNKPWLMRSLHLKRDPTAPVWGKLKRSTKMGHGFDLSEGLVRVPLIIAGANNLPSGQVVTEQVRQVDIMPTILDLVGITPPAGISGRSLLPMVRGLEKGPRPAYMETYGFGRDPDYFMRGLRLPEWKYIDSPSDRRVKRTLFSLTRDSREQHNVIHKYPEVAQHMEYLLRKEIIVQAQQHSTEAWTAEENDIVEERLRNLGYF